MNKTKTTSPKTVTKASRPALFTLKVVEKDNSKFYPEYFVLTQAVEAVNTLDSLYGVQREGKKGPSEHWEQDLCRAMLVFACAGLDVFLKQLIKLKLPELIEHDPAVKIRFQKYVLGKMEDDGKIKASVLALALISDSPKDILLNTYLESFTGESLQSVQQLKNISEAFALPTKTLIKARQGKLDGAFAVRNSIIHEMDINVEKSRSTGHRTRYQRTYPVLADHVKTVLKLAEDIFESCKEKFEAPTKDKK
ncbi:hypothetical protein HY415_02620 [Candidatus Kaiserbacteria bacterium]|nr:hypothetical protein [Candidatus Kaiserbacteria bacterium]